MAKTSIIDTRLEAARQIFMAHRAKCKECGRYEFKTSQLSLMCYRGTILFKDLLSAEAEVVGRQKAAERAAETRKERREAFMEAQRNDQPR